MKTSQKGSIALILLVIIVLVLIGGGVYYFQNRNIAPNQSTTNTTQNIKASEDTALQISPISVSESENSASDFLKLKGMLSTSDTQAITTYLKNKNPSTQDVQKVKNILSQKANVLVIFDQSAAKSKYYCDLTVPNNNCLLNDVRNVANLATVQSDILFRQGKYKEAMEEAFKVLALGQKLEDSNSTLITYLVGISVKNTALTEIQTIAQSGKLTTQDKASYKQKLDQYTNDVTGQKNMIKYEYQAVVKRIDAITSGDSSGITDKNEKDIFDEYQKVKTTQSWNPTETKAMFYKLYKAELDNVDLACGSTYQSVRENIDPSKLDPQSENYVGKIFYATSAAEINSLNNKRCDLLKLYQAIQAALI